MRTCKCGGIIRDEKPYWDILPSCRCQNPEMVTFKKFITSSNTTEFNPNESPTQ